MATIKKLVLAAAILVGATGLASLVGCDDGTGGGGYDMGYSGGYGPIDDDVFQNAADAWSDYIRE